MGKTPSCSLAFVTLEDGHDISELENAGMEVLTCRGRIALVKVDLNEASALSDSPAVKAMSLQKKVKATMDLARESTGVDYIHKGSGEQGLSVPYTGAVLLRQ